MAGKRNGTMYPTKPFPPLAPRPERATATVEHAVKPELMHFDLNGQRARDLEIIRLLNEISSKLDGK